MAYKEQLELLPQLEQRLKSLVRERQRIWQIVHQCKEPYIITVSSGNYKTVLRGTIKVADTLNTYLKHLDDEITLLTGWVANPDSIPPFAIVHHYLVSKYFR